MAQFKIELLTPVVQSTNGNSFGSRTKFLRTTISEFYSQEEEYKKETEGFVSSRDRTFCYTFNEKFSKHKNAQKDFSFSMLKNIWLENEFSQNPFVSAIHVGTQILLTDKNKKQHIFTVKNISYKISTSNITYDYTCQDSFSYQGARQNSGYAINNDPSEDDYIGAKSVDWWIVKKIQPECHISYQYLYLDDALWIDTYGNIQTSVNKKANVKTIIKPEYTKQLYKEYHEEIPFSTSGSTATGALISLAEQLGLSIQVYEEVVNGELFGFFWLEPEKKENISGFKYSPTSTIKDLSFSHAGESLATVLNIESNTVDDEIISLIPSLTPFFANLFTTYEWDSSSYGDQYFTTLCQQKVFRSDGTMASDFILDQPKADGSYLYFKVNGLRIPKLYSNIQFNDGDKVSKFYINEELVTPSTTHWSFGYWKEEINEATKEVINKRWISLLVENSLSSLENSDEIEYFLRVSDPRGENKEKLNISHFDLFFTFYRHASKEDLEFAEIADKCPWLENKLIDFSYFLENNIINKHEYNNLTNIINNTLRKVNGKLLTYTKEYFSQIESKVRAISDLTNKVDSIGAAFQSDVIDAYANDGEVTNTNYFEQAYNTFMGSWNRSEDKKTDLIQYDEILKSYANKYISAQQRFLKNIYNFREYFNSKVLWGPTSAEVYERTLTINYSGLNDKFLIFSSGDWKPFEDTTKLLYKDKENPNKWILKTKLFNQDKKTLAEYVDHNNFKNYKVKKYIEGAAAKDGVFNSNRQYYRYMISTPCIRDGETNNRLAPEETIEVEGIKGTAKLQAYYYSSDNTDDHYFLPGVDLKTVENTLTVRRFSIQDNEAAKVGYKIIPVDVDEGHMIQEYIFNKAKDKNINEPLWFQKSDLDPIQIDWFGKSDVSSKVFGNIEDTTAWLSSLGYDSEDMPQWLITALKDKTIEDKSQQYKLYRSNFPISTIYIRSKQFKMGIDDNGEAIYKPDGDAFKWYELDLVNTSNYTRFYHRGFKKILLLFHDSVGWSTAKYGNKDYDNNSIDTYSGLHNGDETVYAPTSTSYDLYKKHYLDKKPQEKHYYNYYSNRSETYRSAKRKKENSSELAEPYCYKTSFMRVLTTNDYINKEGKYLILPVKVDNNQVITYSFIKKLKANESSYSNKTLFYPIYSMCENIDLLKYHWKDTNSVDVLSFLKEVFGNEVSVTNNEDLKNYGFCWVDSKEEFVVLEEVDYKERKVIETTNIVSYKNLQLDPYMPIFNSNGSIYNPKQETDFATNFYYFEDGTSVYTEDDEFNLDNLYFNDKGERVYTLKQIKHCYYLDSSKLEYENYTADNFSTNAQATLILWEDGKQKVLENANIQLNPIYRTNENDGKIKEYYLVNVIDSNGEEHVFEAQIKTNAINLKDTTNGQLYYKYKNNTNRKHLIEKIASIEAQLEEYWMQAYSASKYCEYFLPEHWQKVVGGKDNMFASKIAENGTLSSTMIPLVKIYSENGKTVLPKYELTNIEVNTHVSDKELNLENSSGKSVAWVCGRNPALKNAMNNLKIVWEDWSMLDLQSTTTYYYAEPGTGWTWQQAEKELSKTSLGDKSMFSGIYLMMFYYIQQNYQQWAAVNYTQALNEHNQIWDNLYKLFPGVILETNYTNQDAGTPTELLTLATNYFKDLSRPERNYNISVIDALKLGGYNGQEINIGDPIQIDAEEYYDEYDDVKKTLSQYLFVTDISYNLRKDTDIQLTVNSIKYQDKLIRRLAKLIIK